MVFYYKCPNCGKEFESNVLIDDPNDAVGCTITCNAEDEGCFRDIIVKGWYVDDSGMIWFDCEGFEYDYFIELINNDT